MQKNKNKNKKVLVHSSWSRLKTGYAHNSRELLKYLHNAGYEVVEYANGLIQTKETEEKTPWKCYGSIPKELINRKDIIKDPMMGSYGSLLLDEVVFKEKPDFIIAAEDVWGIPLLNRSYLKKIPHLIWVTLDSLPLRDSDVEMCSRADNLFVWSPFAKKALQDKGLENVGMVSGLISNDDFFRMDDSKRSSIRSKVIKWGEGEDEKDFTIFGFVFRNQLRKLAPRLLEGFKKFKEENPSEKTKLLFHTNYEETDSWNIPFLIKELGVDNNDVLCSYVCKVCKNVYVAPFEGNGVKCRSCGVNGSASNPSYSFGVTRQQLNLVYNLMDAYIHPATSGGLEIPMCEAMWAGLPCATPNYTYGEDFVSSGLVTPLEFDHYWEVYSNYKKANPTIDSICSFIKSVHFNREFYKDIGAESRIWALDRFDIAKSGKIIEDLIDSTECKFNFVRDGNIIALEKYDLKDIEFDNEWVQDALQNIFCQEFSLNSKEVQEYTKMIQNGVSRPRILDNLILKAKVVNKSRAVKSTKAHIKDSEKLKIVYIMPESLGDCIMSLTVLKSIKTLYKDCDLYMCTKPQYNEIFAPFVGQMIEGVIPYIGEQMDHHYFWEGMGESEKLVDICFAPFILTQKQGIYIHNGKDINELQSPKRG